MSFKPLDSEFEDSINKYLSTFSDRDRAALGVLVDQYRERMLSALHGLQKEITNMANYEEDNTQRQLALDECIDIIDKWFPILLQSSDQKVEDLQDTDKVDSREQTDTSTPKEYHYTLACPIEEFIEEIIEKTKEAKK